MKELNVNEEACIGCGMCCSIDPEHFDFNDDGLSHVISQKNIETDYVKNAIDSCPTNAISYVESVVDEDTCANCELRECEN